MMNKLKISTAGESHGKNLVGIISGFPSGVTIDKKIIETLLKKRRSGLGRSKRQTYETDKFEILAGVIDNVTTGAPIAIIITNNKKSIDKSYEKVTVPRAGHADFAGLLKYCGNDIRTIAERASARRTAMDVAIGSLSIILLTKLGINSGGNILSLGDEIDPEKFKTKIEIARHNGESLGGSVKINFYNLPIGIGDNFVDELRFDSQLGSLLLSIPGVKGIEIGEVIKQTKLNGTKAQDLFFIDNNGFIKRETNYNGGIEGGILNGETLSIILYMKPIPTTYNANESIDIFAKEKVITPSPRADVSVLESLITIAIAKTSTLILDNLLLKFGGDSLLELETNMDNYLKHIKKKYSWQRT